VTATVSDVDRPAAGKVVGRRVRRQDGEAFLTGRAVYTGDVTLPGTTHAALVRSPHPHARIVAIDTTAAEAHPGVLRVVTGAQAAELTDEIPHGLDARHLGGQHAVVRPLAVDKVV
jgi:carbon-monoxide dehydrogenase large subunit